MATLHAAPKSPEGVQAVENIRLSVRALLAVRGMTALELGQMLGLSRARIYERVQGRKAFTVDEVARISSLFGVPVQKLFDGPDALLRAPAQRLVESDTYADKSCYAWPLIWESSLHVTDRLRTCRISPGSLGLAA